MTAKEFNEKYKEYLEDGHYGLDLHSEKVIRYLDEQFQTLVQYPGFKYSQIKSKFDSYRFYCKNVPQEVTDEIINCITFLYLREIEGN